MKFIIKFLRRIGALLFPSLGFMRISFSQEGEDMVLMSFFEDLPVTYKGFYVDIGAHHPFRFSNTYNFYRKGWRGINVDATPGSMIPFSKYRSRDINLEMGVGTGEAPLTFYCFNEPALNTFDSDIAMRIHGKSGFFITSEIKVGIQSMESILDQHLPQKQPIDFFTIDAEGFDLNILLSNNWNKYRPLFILVEASTNHEAREDMLKFMNEIGYTMVARTQRTLLFKREK